MNYFFKNLDIGFNNVALLHIAKRVLDLTQGKFAELKSFVVVLRVRLVHKFTPYNLGAVVEFFFPDISTVQGRGIGAGIYFGFNFIKLQFRKIYQLAPADDPLVVRNAGDRGHEDALPTVAAAHND